MKKSNKTIYHETFVLVPYLTKKEVLSTKGAIFSVEIVLLVVHNNANFVRLLCHDNRFSLRKKLRIFFPNQIVAFRNRFVLIICSIRYGPMMYDIVMTSQ